MTFDAFAQSLAKIEEESSRLRIVSLLASLLQEASAGEVAPLCYLSLGRLGPLFDNPQFNIATKMLLRVLARAFSKQSGDVLASFKRTGDLGVTALSLAEESLVKESSPSLKLPAVYQTLLDIAKDSGAGSQERKLRKTAQLFKTVSPLSAKYLARIVVGSLRLGFSETTVLDALSVLASSASPSRRSTRLLLEESFNKYPDLGKLAHLLKTAGLPALKGIQVQVGVPIKAQLCQRVNSAEKILEYHRGETVAEPKIDGTRVQLHLSRQLPGKPKQGGLFSGAEGRVFIKTFTRNLEETTHQYPEIVASAERLPAESFILDGEAVGFNPSTKEFLPFQETITRKRKHHVAEALARVKLILVVFDLLYFNGRSLLDDPLSKRRALLQSFLPLISKKSRFTGGEIVLGEQKPFTRSADLERYFKAIIAGGGEGIVCKDRSAPYKAGGRGYTWIKFKNLDGDSLVDTLDCLVMGTYFGRGKRAKFGVGAFLAGVLDKKSGLIKTIAKIGTGLSDEEWAKLAELGRSFGVSERPKSYQVPEELIPDRWFAPRVVVSVRADNITNSPLHSAGKALRFPRLIAWREDKAPSDITSLQELTAIQL